MRIYVPHLDAYMCVKQFGLVGFEKIDRILSKNFDWENWNEEDENMHRFIYYQSHSGEKKYLVRKIISLEQPSSYRMYFMVARDDKPKIFIHRNFLCFQQRITHTQIIIAVPSLTSQFYHGILLVDGLDLEKARVDLIPCAHHSLK